MKLLPDKSNGYDCFLVNDYAANMPPGLSMFFLVVYFVINNSSPDKKNANIF